MQLRKNEAENGAEQLQQRSSKKETRDNGAHKKDVVEYGYYNAYQGEKRKNSSFGFGFVWLWGRYQHWHDFILNLDFHAPCSFWLTSGKVWHFLFNMVCLRISRVPRLGLEKPSLSIEDSYRNRTRSRCSRVNQTRNRTRSYGSCSNRLGIVAIFQTFYWGKWSLRLNIPSLSTLDSESESESVSMLSPV